MADKLVYKGGSNVVDHTGDEMQLVLPRAGDIHSFPRWWNKKGTVAYVDCAIFKVTLGTGLVVRLVIPVSQGAMTLEIRHDGNGNFTFPIKGSIERVAVFEEDANVLYKEYQFSKISGGSVLTRTVNAYPGALTFTDSGSITGTIQVGQEITITGAGFSGGVGTVTELYVLQQSDTGTSGWSTVTTSPTSPFTNTLAAAREGKYLRVSTQLTDDGGLKVRNGDATAAVAAA
jgi:hypothetical protein